MCVLPLDIMSCFLDVLFCFCFHAFFSPSLHISLGKFYRPIFKFSDSFFVSFASTHESITGFFISFTKVNFSFFTISFWFLEFTGLPVLPVCSYKSSTFSIRVLNMFVIVSLNYLNVLFDNSNIYVIYKFVSDDCFFFSVFLPLACLVIFSWQQGMSYLVTVTEINTNTSLT